MTGYSIANLKEMIATLGEEKVKTILSDFSCPLNADVERFLKASAVPFAIQGIAATYLVFTSYKGEVVLIGYFTLANKWFTISKTAKLSNTLRKRIAKFCTFNRELQRYEISAPLIAQLGKNFAHGYNTLITGDELLQLACDRVKAVHMLVGGKIAYLECEPKAALMDFYARNGFAVFSERPLDADEHGVLQGDRLMQLLKYFS